MKRKLLIVAAFLLSWSAANAQGVLEANKMSQTDLRGTARSMSMGGAFGALGGDVSAIEINPAGIGVYKSSEIVATLDFQNVDNKTISNFTDIKESKFKVGFNNFAFVGTFPIHNDVAPLVNFGFSYNKVKSFNNKYSMRGSGAKSGTLTEYMADRATHWDGGKYNNNNLKLPDDVSGRDHMWKNEDWLSILAFNSGILGYDSQGFFAGTQGLLVDNALFVEEKGSINKYDFNMGTTFADMLSAGLTVSVTDIDYKMYSTNMEDFFLPEDKSITGGYDLHNGLRTEGTGWQLGLGLIFKPIQELRIGVSYHSPTWYNMTDRFYADIDHNFNAFADNNIQGFEGYKGDGWVKSMDGELYSIYDYKLRTPDKWTFSMAGVLGKNAIISVDYELVDYKKTNLQDRNGRSFDFQDDNDATKNYYRLTSTLRVGGEYRFTPQFSGRVGYSWQQSPYSDLFKNGVDPELNGEGYLFDTAGAVPHYVIGKDTHYITWGLGYRFNRNFYTDVAFVFKTQDGDLYTHAMSEKTKLEQRSFQGSLTLGFRF